MTRATRLRWLLALLGVLAVSGQGVPASADERVGAGDRVEAPQDIEHDGRHRGRVQLPNYAAGALFCEDSSFPTCGGACPPYNVCQAVRVGMANFCTCVGQRAECGVNDPFCGGVCPPGLVCVGDVFGVGSCGCVAPRPPTPRWRYPAVAPPVEETPVPLDAETSTTAVTSTSTTVATTTTTLHAPGEPCADTAYPACGGLCPAGEVCVPHGDASGIDACRCFTAPAIGAACGAVDARACDGACPEGTACVPFDRRRAALLAASGCRVDRDVPLCPRPLSETVRLRLKEIQRQTDAAGESGGSACVCLDVVDAACGLLDGPECGGECPSQTPICRQIGAGCVCTE